MIDKAITNDCYCDSEFFLLRQIPVVLRARGFRLYLADNRRLVDLWLNGGSAVLGHTPPNQLREIKNTASRGLYSPFPHFTEGRYIKALSKLFPESSFRLYAAPPPQLVSFFNNAAVKLWYPFAAKQFTETCSAASANPTTLDTTTLTTPLFIPVLPGIQTWRDGLPFGLCVAVSNPVCKDSENMLAQLPAGDVLSPILLAAAARGVYDIIAAADRAKINFTKAIKKSCWKQNGIYLTLKEENKEWEKLFFQFLKAGFLLPPIPSHPLVLPGELSAGEETKLAAALSGEFPS